MYAYPVVFFWGDAFPLGAHYRFFRADKSALAIDFSTGIQFPVLGNSPVVTGFLMDESLSMATQQDAFWWDGGDYIYK